MDRSQLRTVLGDELSALASQLSSAVVLLEPLLGRGPCSSFRLTLADGQVLKAKRLESAAVAERVDRLLRRLAHAAFPPVYLRRGGSIMTRWVPGQPLGPTAGEADVLRTCGAIHAVVHAARPAAAPPSGRWRSRAHRRAWLQADLDALVAAGWLTRDDAAAVQMVVDRHAPEDWTVGIVHGDFNPENLIRGAAGDIAAIDNETLSIGARAYDLARTWYRWPMDTTQLAAYLEGYGCAGGVAELERHFPFWGLTVLTRGAAFRLRARRHGIAEPMARLRESLETWR